MILFHTTVDGVFIEPWFASSQSLSPELQRHIALLIFKPSSNLKGFSTVNFENEDMSQFNATPTPAAAPFPVSELLLEVPKPQS